MDNILAVESDGTEYSLTKPPDVESKFVVEAQKKLTETLQISELSTDLSNVGKFLLIAYCGVMGHADLESMVRERLISITELCDDTVFTLNEFERASDTAINIMITAYNHLTEGHEDLAFAMLQSVAKLSQNMVDAASNLQKRFATEASEVEKVQAQTMGKRQKVDDAHVETKKSITQHTRDHDFENSEFQKATEEANQTTEKLNRAKRAEERAAENKSAVLRSLEEKLREVQSRLEAANARVRECANQSSGFIGSVVHFFRGKTKEDIEEEKARIDQKSAERKHEMVREEYYSTEYAENQKEKVLKEQRQILEENLRIIRQKQVKASKEMAELAKKLLQCKLEADAQAESLNCLHHALTALRNLQDIMIIAGNFWRNWISFCKDFSANGFIKRINKFMTMDKEERKRIICKSKIFKIEAVKYYANWVAVQQVCSNSRGSITDSQRKLHNYISQKPTKERGRAILKVLTKEFDCKSTTLAITTEEAAAD